MYYKEDSILNNMTLLAVAIFVSVGLTIIILSRFAFAYIERKDEKK